MSDDDETDWSELDKLMFHGNRPMYFDRDGNVLTSYKKFHELHSDRNYVIVAKHNLVMWRVSTVWLGLDHSFTGRRRPVIFETMVFPGDKRSDNFWLDHWLDRYSTLKEARWGHQQVVTMVTLTMRLGLNSHEEAMEVMRQQGL